MLRHPRNASKKFQINISSRTGDIPIWPNFSKKVSKLKDKDKQEICNNLEIVYKHPRNVSKKFRRISHPEEKISLYLSNFRNEVSHLTD